MQDKPQTSRENIFTALLNFIADPVVVVDEKGCFLLVNMAFEGLTGLAKEKVIGKSFLDLNNLNGVNKLILLENLRKRNLGTAVEPYEITFSDTNGETKYAEVKAKKIEYAGQPAELVVFRDITRRKKNEQRLKEYSEKLQELVEKKAKEIKESEEKFRAISNSVNDALVLVDTAGRVIYWNPTAEKIFGYTKEETRGKKLHQLIVPQRMCSEGKIVMEIGLKKFAETGNGPFISENVELTARKKDGTELPIILSLSSILLHGKWHAVGVVRDITEQKQTRKELAQYSQSLEKLIEERTEELKQTQAKLVKSERLATIGELAAMVGHDLRNPLTGIKGATYYLKTKYGVEIDAKGKEMLKVIDLCIDYSNKIIDDLLEYSREMNLDLGETNPKKLLRHAMSMLRIPRNIQVTNAAETEPKIIVDKAKINRVFVNIIKNAFDAMPKGGTLTITSKAAENDVAIAFTDTGVGMSKETLSELGSPLFTTKAKGMGFGLSICKRIVDAHGGKISVESIIGKGTTITVMIPINPVASTENAEASVFNGPEVSVLAPQKVETENS